MSKQQHIEKCSQCNRELLEHFCSACELPRKITKINGAYILAEIGSVLNFDKGILFTIRELLLRPGLSVRKFIFDDRSRLVRPIVFIIVCSLIYTIFQRTFQFEDGYVNYSFEENTTTYAIFTWLTKNYGYTNILMAVLIAFWIKIFFRRSGYNFFEILILLFFVMGVGMLIFSFFGMIDSQINFKIIDKGFLIGILYISWGIGRFFDKGKKLNFIKGFLSYMLGLASFSFIAVVVGFFIDWVNKL